MCCGLHYSEDLTSLLPSVMQHTCSSEKPNPLRLEIHVGTLLPCLVGGISATLPAVLLFYTECCSVLTQFMHRKIFSLCGIPASHGLIGNMNLQHLLPSWHYSALFTPSHNTSALIVLIERFCHEEQFDILCRVSNLVSALIFSFIHYEKEHTPSFPIILP